MHFTLPALCITATLLLAFAGFVGKQRVWRVWSVECGGRGWGGGGRCWAWGGESLFDFMGYWACTVWLTCACQCGAALAPWLQHLL